jgi:hypothetical protein
MTTKSITTHKWNHSKEHKKGHTMVGLALAIIGFFWFAKKIGWIPVVAGDSSIFWPTVTIAAGVAIFLSARHRRKSSDPNSLPNNTEYFG